MGKKINDIRGDIRDYDSLKRAFNATKPEIVFHLAAQPIVITGYEKPRYTYETNVMGTVNVLECVRESNCVRSMLNVTTDKVYMNKEWEWGYRENELLDGFDPYSNSKSCSELVTHSYVGSFLKSQGIAVSTARAGNVIGGGDFANERIIPDCIRAVKEEKNIVVRNPYSVRPYQHVLEPLFAYLLIGQRQYEDIRLADWYNVGPDEQDCITTGELADLFCKKWGNVKWEKQCVEGPHEANYLKLDCSKIKNKLGWKTTWNVGTAIEKTVDWTKVYFNGASIIEEMEREIREFIRG